MPPQTLGGIVLRFIAGRFLRALLQICSSRCVVRALIVAGSVSPRPFSIFPSFRFYYYRIRKNALCERKNKKQQATEPQNGKRTRRKQASGRGKNHVGLRDQQSDAAAPKTLNCKMESRRGTTTSKTLSRG
ncbi:MAG: hypothetical protein KF708_04025 [Pirellulales bacterium]|nr:hypothetical protein [Pirellulales bacterium]